MVKVPKLPKKDYVSFQEALNKLIKPKPPLEVDGKVGKKTLAAVKLFQKKAGLEVTGKIDFDTADKLYVAVYKGKIEKIDKEEKERKENREVRLYFNMNGQWVGLTRKEFALAKKKIGIQLRKGPVKNIAGIISEAEGLRSALKQFQKEQPIVNYLSHFGLGIPDERAIAQGRKMQKSLEKFADGGNLDAFVKVYPGVEDFVSKHVLGPLLKYQKDMVVGAQVWVKYLSFTKTASFTFLGVFSAPVTAAALGTGVLASAMIGGAAVAAIGSTANEIGKYSAGTKGWSLGSAFKNISIDTAIGAFTGWLTKGGGGKHIVEAAVERLGPKIATEAGFKFLSKETAKKVAVYLVSEGGKSSIEGALKDAGELAKGGKKMTEEKLLDNALDNFYKGVALGPFGAVVDKFAKNTIKNLDKKDLDLVWKTALKEVSKQAKGQTIDIGMIEKRTKDLAEKAMGDQIKKVLDEVVGGIFENAKGALTAKAVEKKIKEQMFTPEKMKMYQQIAIKSVKAQMKKKKR